MYARSHASCALRPELLSSPPSSLQRSSCRVFCWCCHVLFLLLLLLETEIKLAENHLLALVKKSEWIWTFCTQLAGVKETFVDLNSADRSSCSDTAAEMNVELQVLIMAQDGTNRWSRLWQCQHARQTKHYTAMFHPGWVIMFVYLWINSCCSKGSRGFEPVWKIFNVFKGLKNHHSVEHLKSIWTWIWINIFNSLRPSMTSCYC